jgi:Coenzyme PQQ synthesis protein D (PqqD)
MDDRFAGSDDDRLRRIAGSLECDVRGELLVYVPGTSAAVALNTSARAVWDLCVENATVTSIADALSRRLGIPRQALLPDVRQTVEQLHGLGLLRPEDN